MSDAELASEDHEPAEETTLEGDPFGYAFDAFRRESAERIRKYSAYIATGEYETDLRRAYESLEESESFVPGELVQWKTFMREREFPDYGAPAVVLGALQQSRPRTRQSRETYPEHDLLLGLLDGDQDFVTFSAASSRLMRWETP